MKSALFSPIEMRGLTLSNRIVIAPMCTYSADDGNANDWHLMHMGQYAVSGTGMFITEATAVSPEGRISDKCIGLYTDENEAALARIPALAKSFGNAAMCVQLAHAGRKGATRGPGSGLPPGPLGDDGGWPLLAPSAIAFEDGWPTPDELDLAGIKGLVEAFTQAAIRADRIGFDAIELHGAHGYLMHQFLSPLSNTRVDAYGGSLENRMRFVLEVYDAVRAVWPDTKPMGIRVSATDWIDGGWDVQDTIALAKTLEKRKCDFFHVSTGGTANNAVIPAGPGYQVPFAQQIKTELSHMPVIAVGQITNARQAETIVRSGQADMIALGRAMLFNPHWTWQAAAELGAEAPYPYQYARSHPSLWSNPIPPGKPPAQR